MALNTSHTPDRRGVLIYNGEMILLYVKEVSLMFDPPPDVSFKGSKKGPLYLTSHRIIFTSKDERDRLQSFCMPFHCLRNVKLEQPIFGANYLKGVCLAQPGGNFEGEATFQLSFNQGGCIEFGQALLQAADIATRFRPASAPPPYAPPPGGFFSPPPSYYTPRDSYNGFAPPRHIFPDAPPAADVYMYEAPPPYTGIGPDQGPYPAGPSPNSGNSSYANGPSQATAQDPQLPTYDEATKLKQN